MPGLLRLAVRLEQFSIGWMAVEAGVAVTAGIIAGSLALTSFGFDSVIELVSAALVLGRLRAEARGGRASERAERKVLRVIAVTFFVPAAYVLTSSVINLATQAHPERSLAGIGLTAASLLVMPLLGWRKRRVGSVLGNPLVLADAAETASLSREEIAAWELRIARRGYTRRTAQDARSMLTTILGCWSPSGARRCRGAAPTS